MLTCSAQVPFGLPWGYEPANFVLIALQFSQASARILLECDPAWRNWGHYHQLQFMIQKLLIIFVACEQSGFPLGSFPADHTSALSGASCSNGVVSFAIT